MSIVQGKLLIFLFILFSLNSTSVWTNNLNMDYAELRPFRLDTIPYLDSFFQFVSLLNLSNIFIAPAHCLLLLLLPISSVSLVLLLQDVKLQSGKYLSKKTGLHLSISNRSNKFFLRIKMQKQIKSKKFTFKDGLIT